MKQLFWILAIVPSMSLANEDFARLTNIRTSSPFCEGKLSIQDDTQGATIVRFENIQVARGNTKPFVRCRLLADLFIPARHIVTSDAMITAQVQGHVEQIGDQVAARLLLSLLDQRSSNFLMQRQTEAIASELGEEHRLEIQVPLPSNPISENDRTISLVIQIEGMINYRLDQNSKVSVLLDSIRIPQLQLSDSALTPSNGDA